MYAKLHQLFSILYPSYTHTNANTHFQKKTNIFIFWRVGKRCLTTTLRTFFIQASQNVL